MLGKRNAYVLIAMLWVVAVMTAAAGDRLTLRFGDGATGDVRGAAMDAALDGAHPEVADGEAETLYFRWDRAVVMRFDLSSIPPGTRVVDARLRLFLHEGFHDGGTTGVLLPLHRIEDPDGTGLWSEAEASHRWKRRGVAWSQAGGLYTVRGPMIGELYFRTWTQIRQKVVQADLTGAVQYWVDHPERNLGFMFECAKHVNLRLAAHEHKDELLRPYLQVTIEAEQTEAIAQADAVRVAHEDGQTFVTWREAQTGRNETGYRIYRHTEPITSDNLDAAQSIDEVWQGSSWLHDGEGFRQPDLSPIGLELEDDSGLAVHIARETGPAWYAVTTVVEGNENRRIEPGRNATVEPVEERPGPGRPFEVARHGSGYYVGYAIWLGNYNPLDPADAYGFHSRPSAPFLFSVAEPMRYVPGRRYPLTLFLHAFGKTYFGSEEGRDPSRYYDDAAHGGFTVGISDWSIMVARLADGRLVTLGPFLETDAYGHSYFSGWNSNYLPGGYEHGLVKTQQTGRPFEAGRSVPYVEKSIIHVLDWMHERSPWAELIDPERTYATGGSMGGAGALALALHYPEKFTAVNAFLARLGLRPNGKYGRCVLQLYGTEEMAVPTPEGVDIHAYYDFARWLQLRPDAEYPPMRMHHGKRDESVPWSALNPAFYRAAADAGVALVAFWDQRTHSEADREADFPTRVGERDLVKRQREPLPNPFRYRSDAAYPAFVDCSLNDDPGDGRPDDGDARGGIHHWILWDERTVEESASGFSAEVWLHEDAPEPVATIALVPRNLQRWAPRAGDAVAWRVLDGDGRVLQEGRATVAANGRLRVEGVAIAKDRRRVVIGGQSGASAWRADDSGPEIMVAQAGMDDVSAAVPVALGGAAADADRVTSGLLELEAIETYGALVSGGVDLRVANLTPNVRGRLYYRPSADAQAPWREGHPFVRYDGNHMATSLFDLEPDTAYEVLVTVADGETTITRTATLTTRPEWRLPEPRRTVEVVNDLELTAALADLRPGDHLLLAPTTFTLPVYLQGKSGAPDAPIVLRSRDAGRRAVLKGGMHVVQSRHVMIHDLELVGGGGLKLRGAQYCDVVGNVIRESGGTIGSYAIHLSHNELIEGENQNFHILIQGNELIEEENSNSERAWGAFPDQTYYGIKHDDGVGGMVIICNNVIRGFADGIAPGGDEGEAPVLGPDAMDLLETWPNQNVDIHDNVIDDVSDDGIELDGHLVNARVFRNTIGLSRNAITAAPVYPGPIFIVRNTLHGFTEGALKLNTQVAGETRNVYFYHNTVVQQPDAKYCIYRGMPAKTRDVIFRNNILSARERIIDTDIGSNHACEWYHINHDFDNDLMWTELPRTGNFVLFKWGYSDYSDNQRYNTLGHFQSGTAWPRGFEFTCPDQRVIEQEPNGILADPDLAFEPLTIPGMSAFIGRFVPQAGSPAIDAAAVLPGINDRYLSEGPDIGAAESKYRS